MEVTVQSNMGALLKQPEFGGLDENTFLQFISLCCGESRDRSLDRRGGGIQSVATR